MGLNIERKVVSKHREESHVRPCEKMLIVSFLLIPLLFNVGFIKPTID